MIARAPCDIVNHPIILTNHNMSSQPVGSTAAGPPSDPASRNQSTTSTPEKSSKKDPHKEGHRNEISTAPVRESQVVQYSINKSECFTRSEQTGHTAYDIGKH